MISAVATDSKGVSGRSFVYVKITAGGVGYAPPSSTSPRRGRHDDRAGANLTFTASALDDVDGDRSNGITWVSTSTATSAPGPSITVRPLGRQPRGHRRGGRHRRSLRQRDRQRDHRRPALTLEPVADGWTDASLRPTRPVGRRPPSRRTPARSVTSSSAST
jgi:hypothetical protein